MMTHRNISLGMCWKTVLSHLNTVSNVCFLQAACSLKNFHGRPISSRVFFLRRAVWADSVSPQMNTIASRDQLKPIRIGENLVVNYNIV